MLLVQLFLETLKWFYQHYLKWSISITQEQNCTFVNLFNFLNFRFSVPINDYTYIKVISVYTIRTKWFRRDVRKKVNDVNSFDKPNINSKELTTNFEVWNHKWKKKYKKHKKFNYKINVIWYKCYYCYNMLQYLVLSQYLIEKLGYLLYQYQLQQHENYQLVIK